MMQGWCYWTLYMALLLLLSFPLGGCGIDLCFIGCQKGDANAQEPPPPSTEEPENVFIPRGTFTAEYSGAIEGSIIQRAIGITAVRNKRNLGDLFLSFSFFPPQDSNPAVAVGRATLSIHIPRRDTEDVEEMQNEDISITSSQPSNTLPSADYQEDGDEPFDANAISRGLINFRFEDGDRQIVGTFRDFTFTGQGGDRTLTNGRFSAFVDRNPVEEGFQFSDSRQ